MNLDSIMTQEVEEQLSDLEMQYEDDDCDDPIDNDDYEICNDEDGGEEEIAVADSVAQLAGHSKDVFCLSVSNSKRWLASGAEDDTACIWDLDNTQTLDCYHRINYHKDSVNCVSFNASSTLLSTGDMSGLIICTDIEMQKERCKIDDCTGLEWILWHSTADILFGGSTDGMIWMWLIGTAGVLQSKIYSRGAGFACLKGLLLPDSKQLLSVYSDGDVRIWNLKESTSTAIQLKSAGYSVDVHPTLPLAAIGCADGTTALVNTLSMKVVNSFGKKMEQSSNDNNMDEETGVNAVEAVYFSPQLSWLSVGTTGGALTIYNYETSTIRHSCGHDGYAVVSSRWRLEKTTNTLQIISICMDGGVRMWDAKTGEPIKANSCGQDGVYDFCIVERDEIARIFVACGGGLIRVFNC